MGVALQIAAYRAKSIIRSILKTDNRRLTYVQAAGVTCCLLRTLMYSYTVAFYHQTLRTTRHYHLEW